MSRTRYRPRLRGHRRSLRKRLLTFLLIPLMLVLLADSALTYYGALLYSNHIHDRGLADDALTLAKLLDKANKSAISDQARFLLEYDPEGHHYFSIHSRHHGLQEGSDYIPLPAQSPMLKQSPVVYSTYVKKHPVRAAAMIILNPHDSTDQLTLTVAETLYDRHKTAREILLLTIPAQGLLILSVFALIWFGVNRGLRELEPLTSRLAEREHDLTPISGADVPEEILPLTRTIDALFARLRGMLFLQERFIADAAHQLRTPLAGLQVHAERAQQNHDRKTLDDALGYIQRLTQRASRTSTQLLALTRAQSPAHKHEVLQPVDLNQFVPKIAANRVHEALAAGIDLGYEEDSAQPAWIMANASSLQELLDNLIDNGLRYAGRGSSVTVAILRSGNDHVLLSVEDTGAGVAPAFLSRLGERFFRVPGNAEDGSGLGLAIVRRIAERHAAEVRYLRGEYGGLRVEIRFPLLKQTA